MRVEPAIKRVVAFVDGQNLFHTAKESFGYTYPNYDVQALARKLCEGHGWQYAHTRFYTGVPDASDDLSWNRFWVAKLRAMSWQGVIVYQRPLRYRNKRIKLPDGTQHTFMTGEEKGIDVRIAIDVIRLAHSMAFDVALLLSQDQDLSEVADEIRTISQEQDRWL